MEEKKVESPIGNGNLKDINSAQPKQEKLMNQMESEKIYDIELDAINSQVDSINNFKFGIQGSSQSQHQTSQEKSVKTNKTNLTNKVPSLPLTDVNEKKQKKPKKVSKENSGQLTTITPRDQKDRLADFVHELNSSDSSSLGTEKQLV